MLEMQLFNSKQEYRAITGRMQEGRLLSVREGNFLSSSPPFGYDIDKPDRYTRTLKPNEDAETVKLIFDLLVKERMTCGEIAKLFTKDGIPTAGNCGEWHRNSIRWIVQNPVYIGKIRWQMSKMEKEMGEDGKIEKHRRKKQKYILIDGKQPAIIDEETFAKAQEFFAGNVPLKKGGALLNTFAGLLVCAKCGRNLVYVNQKKPRLSHAPSNICSAKSASYEEVEALVCRALREYIEEFSFKLDNADKMEMAKKHTAEMERLERELEKAKEKRRRLFDDYEEGNYTAEEFRERKTVWADRISNLSGKLEEMQFCKPEEIDYQERIVSFTAVLDALNDDTISPKEKNILLKEIIDKIKYSREGEERAHTYGGKITLDIVLKE